MKDESEKIWPKPKVLAITEISCANEIFQILNCVHMNGRKDDEVAKKLVCLLIKQEEWGYGHGMELYELILRQYSDEDMLNQLLAVSGQSDGYRNLSTPAKRRKKYSDSHPEIVIAFDAMDKAEKTELRRIAKDVYCDFINNHNRLHSLYEKWISQMGLDPKILEKPDSSEPKEKLEPRGSQTRSRTSGHKRKQMTGTKKDKKSSGKKPRRLVNIIAQIEVSYTKVAIEKPQYGLGILVVLFVVLMSVQKVFFKTPKIEDISVAYPELELVAGERKDPGIGVRPDEADRDSLQYTIKDPSIADVTQEWKVIGGDGWREGANNTTTITLHGGSAEDVKIFITLKPRFTDRADREAPVDGEVGEQQ